MKDKLHIILVSLLVAVASLSAFAQSGGIFEIKKSVIAGGGGNSVGGIFELDGTIGQSLAGVSSTGGEFQLTGGFWGGSAAPIVNVSITGRVTTPSGLNLGNTRVSLIDEFGGRRIATTSSFGIYRFDLVLTGQTYTMTVASKRYRFAPRIMLVNTSLTNIDFVGLE
ncbi:MAG: carboxypeptidase-like regulatory domain-containing protein [Pyrinomonadaceae bacterium]